MLKEIIDEVPIFKTREEKERFLIVLSALSLRLISLSKACEIMNMDRETLIKFFDAVGYDFSYLEESDIEIERSWYEGNI